MVVIFHTALDTVAPRYQGVCMVSVMVPMTVQLW